VSTLVFLTFYCKKCPFENFSYILELVKIKNLQRFQAEPKQTFKAKQVTPQQLHLKQKIKTKNHCNPLAATKKTLTSSFKQVSSFKNSKFACDLTLILTY
jgi:uncharacterized glyoxalase superfamily metalloenzyme YdcJ